MKTYQDLKALGANEAARAAFVDKAVSEHMTSAKYRVARDAEAYYAKHNITMEKYVKVIMNALGQAVPDVWSSNYKLTHGFFRRFVLQQTQYVLSNGVTFEKPETKDKLGRDFDNKLQDLAKRALVGGVSFGFWNIDHLDVFSFADTPSEPGFVPLYDEETGYLCAGVRYWTPTQGVRRWTLYELDGYTDYIKRKDESIRVLNTKRAYAQISKVTQACGVEEVEGMNYSGFPIIPMYANDLKESEIVGIRAAIDCYDFIKSGMANNVDENSAFYWTLKNTGGMDDEDLANFVTKMKQLHAVTLDRGVEADAHTLAVPYEANKMLLDYLKDDMYADFMLLNADKALSGDKTATAIRLAYQAQDDKSGDFEYCISDFINRLLDLLGIDDTPSFKWNRIANQTEETQMVMTAAQYLDDEAVLKHLPWLTPEEVDELLKRRENENVDRVISAEPPVEEPEVEE